MDNRIRYPEPEINFSVDVGLTGQAHDDYPEKGTAPRFDWMRLYLIGLLSNQSSELPPCEYRPGTVWFDLLRRSLMFHRDPIGNPYFQIGNFIPICYGIQVTTTVGTATTDESIYELLSNFMSQPLPNNDIITFSGVKKDHDYVTGATVDSIKVPISVTQRSGGLSIIMFKNGKSINPSIVQFNLDRTEILLSGDARMVSGNDKFIFWITDF